MEKSEKIALGKANADNAYDAMIESKYSFTQSGYKVVTVDDNQIKESNQVVAVGLPSPGAAMIAQME